MKTLTRGSAAAVLGIVIVAGVTLLGAGVAGAATLQPPFRVPLPFTNHAVFVQSDNPSGNQILAYDQASRRNVDTRRHLRHGRQWRRGDRLGRRPLASQGSLTLADSGHTLLAVDVGSNSVSVFRVYGAALALWQVVPSGGEFPTSTAGAWWPGVRAERRWSGLGAGLRLGPRHPSAVAGVEPFPGTRQREPAQLPGLTGTGGLHP